MVGHIYFCIIQVFPDLTNIFKFHPQKALQHLSNNVAFYDRTKILILSNHH
jgi:hypothetical protein